MNSTTDISTLASAGFREREDLQRWVTSHPELIAPGLLLITTEFDRWEIKNHKVADRPLKQHTPTNMLR
jgi:hypothetical protein